MYLQKNNWMKQWSSVLRRGIEYERIKVVGICSAHARRTAVSVYVILRDRWWLEDELKWPVKDKPKMK